MENVAWLVSVAAMGGVAVALAGSACSQVGRQVAHRQLPETLSLPTLAGPPSAALRLLNRAGYGPRPDDLARVTAMGTKAGINRLLTGYIRGPGHGTGPRRATIVGGGSVGLAVARGLQEAGWDVKVVEASRERCDEIEAIVARVRERQPELTDLYARRNRVSGADAV